eukprot:scaffold207016_cov30-Attheya_sp.AAC.1
MGSVDASRSCASNPGQRFGIGRLVVELAYTSYCMLHEPLLWLVVSLCVFQWDQSMRLVLAV